MIYSLIAWAIGLIIIAFITIYIIATIEVNQEMKKKSDGQSLIGHDWKKFKNE